LRITDFIDEKKIFLGLPPAPKEELLASLVDAAIASGIPLPRDAVLTRLLVREREASTGLASGIAIPHANVAGVQGTVIFLATVPGGCDFESLDGEATKLLILVLHPVDRLGDHVRVLARLARLAHNQKVIDRICQADPQSGMAEVMAALRDDDDHHLGGR